MNRKERRAARKQDRPTGPDSDLAEAAAFQRAGRTEDAIRAYKRHLFNAPEHAEAINNLAVLLQQQGKAGEASARYAQALTLMPQLFDQFPQIAATLLTLLPSLAEAVRRAATVFPALPSLADMFGAEGVRSISNDPLLLCTLQTVPVRDSSLERAFTALRAALLNAPEAGDLALRCALARQCFINEYVWPVGPIEEAQVRTLSGTDPAKLGAAELAMLAAYTPLHSLPFVEQFASRKWPAPFDDVVTQQVREPAQERAIRATIPKLTAIEDDVSLKVQAQYQDNPYPRWTRPIGNIEPISVDRYLRGLFPTSAFTPLGDAPAVNILVAGCGTGWQATGTARKFERAQVLAIDLSLTSLAYAVRNTPPALKTKIDYAQADILKLARLDRRFDLIEASGVLHHMANPLEGWRVLLGLLRPGGLMHLAFYSEIGRQEIVAARNYLLGKGYTSSSADIRRARQDLLQTPYAALARFNDFFSTSECRDMLFHVQEHRVTVPKLQQYIEELGLKFVGFEFNEAAQENFRTLFAQSGWLLSDLRRWDEVEKKYPDTFSGMYHFWLQKP